MKNKIKYIAIFLIGIFIIKSFFTIINNSFALSNTKGTQEDTLNYKTKDITDKKFKNLNLDPSDPNNLNNIKHLSEELKSIEKAAGNSFPRASELWNEFNTLNNIRALSEQYEEKQLGKKLTTNLNKHFQEKILSPLSDLTSTLKEHATNTKGLTNRINEKPTHSG